jgi:hypothetical protein
MGKMSRNNFFQNFAVCNLKKGNFMFSKIQNNLNSQKLKKKLWKIDEKRLFSNKSLDVQNK